MTSERGKQLVDAFDEAAMDVIWAETDNEADIAEAREKYEKSKADLISYITHVESLYADAIK